jgi:hypothetical protein
MSASVGRRLAAALLALLAMLPAGLRAAPVVRHELQVRIDPDSHQLEVRDRLHVPAALVREDLTFTLLAGLQLQDLPGRPALQPLHPGLPDSAVGTDRVDPTARVPVKVYRLPGLLPGQDYRIELVYRGRIDHPVRQVDAAYARGAAQSPGLIEARGVVLSGATHWVPQIDELLLSYTLDIDLPAGWKSVSQGERLASAEDDGRRHERWQVPTPSVAIDLIAARFSEYSRDFGKIKAMALLRQPDAALAARYLEATGQYLQMYQDLLGDYPYGKFALVENFWETGYGMPSFTLLGEQIIRFPFILHSAYPHELLHNWWGNGVFVDAQGGNWCEGLTAYLADHLVAEQRGLGSEHRRDILQRVSDHVTPALDFPLSQFQGRHDAVSEAVGYGKSAMLWNMLRVQIGDPAFVAGLRAFYRQHVFATAGFDDLRLSFEAASGQPLAAFFAQWVQRPGTPELRLQAARVRGTELDLTLAQVQPGPAFALDVPVAVQTASGVEMKTVSFAAGQGERTATLVLRAVPLRVQVDPQFQVYRRLSPLETPPALSRAFGSARVLIVTPGADAGLYAGLVKAWRRDGVEVVADSELQTLPADRAVWVLGADNRHAATVARGLLAHAASLDAGGTLGIAADRFEPAGRSLVATLRHPDNPDNPAAVLVYASAPSAAAATALARKLPHYGKYSWLVFAGDAADNEAKGSWAVRDTPLARELVAGAAPLQLQERQALAELKPLLEAQRPASRP